MFTIWHLIKLIDGRGGSKMYDMSGTVGRVIGKVSVGWTKEQAKRGLFFFEMTN